MDDILCVGSLAFFRDDGGWHETAVDLLSANNLKGARYVLQSPERLSMKSVHRGSLSNSRPYNTTVLYKRVLENDEYASRHSLDIGASTYTRVLHFGRYFSHKDGVDLYAD